MLAMEVFSCIAVIAALFTPSLGVALPRIPKRDTGLKVKLSQLVAGSIDAVLTNTGGEALKLLDYGTLMDKNPVQKLNVVKDGVEVLFTGIDARYKMTDLLEDAFTTLGPGESFTSIINIAALHDVTGGQYTVSTVGAIPYAAPDSTEIVGSIPYSSNILQLSLSEEEVAIVPRAVPVLDRRTILTTCSGERGREHLQAVAQTITVAGIAAQAARWGDNSTFQTYFKTIDSSIRENVALRYEAVANEASSTTSGATRYYCDDEFNYCYPNTLAYSLPSQNLIANCPLYYTLSSLSRVCGEQDQTTTALHEFTHSPSVFSPPTQDYAYGYYASSQLSPAEALMNADSYALYANAVLNNCSQRVAVSTIASTR